MEAEREDYYNLLLLECTFPVGITHVQLMYNLS